MKIKPDKNFSYNLAEMSRLKKFLLILITLWLPIQATAAMSMSVCRHTTEPVAVVAVNCHEHEAQPTDTIEPEIKLGCDNCALCHLASAGFLLAPIDTLLLHAASILVPKLTTASASHIPEPPQQPPRR